jgi:hypothetical protein
MFADKGYEFFYKVVCISSKGRGIYILVATQGGITVRYHHYRRGDAPLCHQAVQAFNQVFTLVAPIEVARAGIRIGSEIPQCDEWLTRILVIMRQINGNFAYFRITPGIINQDMGAMLKTNNGSTGIIPLIPHPHIAPQSVPPVLCHAHIA